MTTDTDKIEEPIRDVVEYLEQNFKSFHAWQFTDEKRIELAKKLRSLSAELTELRQKNRVLELKANNSLANNLCPDHRDKQAGKSCLARGKGNKMSELSAISFAPDRDMSVGQWVKFPARFATPRGYESLIGRG